MPAVEFDLTGNSDDLVSALSEAEQAFFDVGDAAEDAAKKTKKVDSASTSAAGGAGKLKVGLESAEKAAAGMGGKVGEVAGRLKNFGEAGAGVASLVGSGGPLTIGLAVAAAAIAGIGIAAVGATSAMLATVSASADLYDELEPFRDLGLINPIAPDTVDAMNNTKAAMASLSTIFKEAVVLLGAELAPTMEDLSFQLVKLSLMALDAWQSFLDGQDILRGFANWVAKELFQALLRPVDAVYGLIGALGKMMSAMGMADNAFSKANEGWEKFSEEVGKKAVDAALGLAEDGYGALVKSTGDYDERAKALIKTQRDLTKTFKDARDIYKEMQDAGDSLLAIQEEISARGRSEADQVRKDAADRHNAIQEQITDIQNLLKAEETTAAQRESLLYDLQYAQDLLVANRKDMSEHLMEIAEEETKKLKEEYQKRKDEYLKIVKEQEDKAQALREAAQDATIGGIDDMLSATQDLADLSIRADEDMTDSQKAAAMTAFRVSQAAALVQIAINTAVAVTKALAQLGPIAGGVAAAGITATGVAQAAIVSTQQAPEFAMGSVGAVVPGDLINLPGGTTSPDHGLAKVAPGEVIVSGANADAFGAAVRSGNFGGGPQVIQMQYKHRIYDRFVTDNLSKGGPLYDAINGSRRRGHRRRN